MPKSTLPAAMLAFILGLVLSVLAMKLVYGNYTMSDGFFGIAPANMRFSTMVGAGVGAVAALITIGIPITQKVAYSLAVLLPLVGAIGFGVFLVTMGG